MKLLVLAVLLIKVLVTLQESDDNEKELYKKLVDESLEACLKENKVNLESVSKIWTNSEYSASNDDKCFYNCMNVKLGVTNDDGDISEDEIIKAYSYISTYDVDTKIKDKCKKVETKNGDLCEFGYELVKCVASMLQG